MSVILENAAALAWLILAVVTAVRLRRWDRSFSEMLEELKAEHEEEKEPLPRHCLFCMNSILTDAADGTEILICFDCKGYEGKGVHAAHPCDNYKEMP